ncbi:hypothetical protein GCM10017557_48310 [Streptomyces aurantiacus]|uniref:Uncharacterized protein n=1 Tax=Streptomyces aurantiacus TaxID=47760 RepID=A0A7G1P4P4_9ACTN|nr:hypothetical protein GCM10017557_48310 [Streptomyces aurantiacus]
MEPDSVSAEIRDFTAESPIAVVPFHFGVQLLPSAMTKARLYVDGEPAESLSEAVVALTYGAYAVPEEAPDEPPEGDALLCGRLVEPESESEESSVAEEHPAVARAITQKSPAAGLRKVLIEHAPTFVLP